MKITMEFNKKELRDFDKDIDRLLSDIGRELASAPKMRPMVDKVRQGMAENSMKFSNSEIWDDTKALASYYGIVDFDSPLMMTGQLVNDFIFYAGKPKITNIPYSDEFVLGYFTWATKERRRPSYRHTLNQIAKSEGRTAPYPGAEKYTYIKSNDLIKIIMRSPRYPIMDSIMSLYAKDIAKHSERLINKAFSKNK